LVTAALGAVDRGAAAVTFGEPASFRALTGFFVAGLGFVVDVLLDVLPDVFTDRADLPRVTFPEETLAVFLRVFLDIRLPFVAFSGSIIKLLRVAFRQT
jgi:hypothetical protein